ncbi:MAG: orotidine-5'-phosphate decarboxylase [Gemmatimonadota bacterium]
MPGAEVIVALDFPSGGSALELVDRLGGRPGFFKVGLELFTREGPAIVRELQARGHRVFLDLKLHDIPNTVAGAARAAAELGADLLTVHAVGGPRMVAAARGAVEGSPTRLLGVTVLTSHSSVELAEAWGRPSAVAEEEVERLAISAVGYGAHGIVAAAGEARRIRDRLGPEVLIVVPGVRLPGEDPGDQARTATPAEAVSAGATYLVVGRTVTKASDPAVAAEAVRAAMERGGRSE